MNEKLHNLQGKLIQKINQFFKSKNVTDYEFSRLDFFLFLSVCETKGIQNYFFFLAKLKFLNIILNNIFRFLQFIKSWQS